MDHDLDHDLDHGLNQGLDQGLDQLGEYGGCDNAFGVGVEVDVSMGRVVGIGCKVRRNDSVGVSVGVDIGVGFSVSTGGDSVGGV